MAGWGAKKEMLIAEQAAQAVEITLLRERVVELKEEKDDLRKQLTYTQDALVAKESPDAYRDRMIAEDEANAAPLTAEQEEYQKNLMIKAKATKDYIQGMEGPLFKSAEEMHDLLMGALRVEPGATKSLHGNNES